MLSPLLFLDVVGIIQATCLLLMLLLPQLKSLHKRQRYTTVSLFKNLCYDCVWDNRNLLFSVNLFRNTASLAWCLNFVFEKGFKIRVLVSRFLNLFCKAWFQSFYILWKTGFIKEFSLFLLLSFLTAWYTPLCCQWRCCLAGNAERCCHRWKNRWWIGREDSWAGAFSIC